MSSPAPHNNLMNAGEWFFVILLSVLGGMLVLCGVVLLICWIAMACEACGQRQEIRERNKRIFELERQDGGNSEALEEPEGSQYTEDVISETGRAKSTEYIEIDD